MNENNSGALPNRNCLSFFKSLYSSCGDGYNGLPAQTKVVLIVFCAIFVFMFWRLGSYPAYFDEIVDHMAYVQVSKVFDHAVVDETTSWYWKSIHTHGAVESPVYGIAIEIGLRLFGLTLFGVRIIPTLFAFFSLILTYLVFRKYLSKYLLLCIISLMALSPWYLMAARSGSISGFSISLYLIAISMFGLLINHKRAIGLAVLAGISAAIIPYGYSGIRLLLPLLVLLAIMNYKRIEKYNFIVYLCTILAVCSIQISNLPESLHMYFFARGEGLNSMAKLQTGRYDLAVIVQKIRENFIFTYNLLLGRNDPACYWNANIAKDFSSGDVILYPKFLVPFFILGLIYCTIQVFTKRQSILFIVMVLFVTGLIPGMMSGLGTPNLVRSTALLVPLYFLIGYGIYSLFGMIYNISGQRLKRAFPALLLFFIILISGYQVNNYFSFEKSAITKNPPTTIMYREFLGDFINNHPDAKILIHEPENDYINSYVNIRWLGGPKMQKMIENSQIKFLRRTNRYLMERLVQRKYFDIIATSAIEYDGIEGAIPEASSLPSETYGCYKIYYQNEAMH